MATATRTAVRVPHSRPTLPEDGIAVAMEALAPDFVAQGPCVRRFEAGVAAVMGTAGAVATNSGTSALHLALVALGIGPGDEVILPSYVCVAALHAVRHAGATPVLADIEPDGFNISPRDAERKITRRTRAVLVPHLFGAAADLDALLALDVPIVEDCAQSFGARWRNRPLGCLGAAAMVSFYATKVITTGEGGAAVASDPGVVAELRDLADYDNRYDDRVRFSYKMSDLQAALGIWQLDRLPDFLTTRRQIMQEFNACLAKTNAILPRFQPQDICYRYVVRVPGGGAEVIRALQAIGIDAKRPVFRPLHRLTGGHYPNTDRAYHEAVSLPLYPSLSESQIERVLECARRVLTGLATAA